MAIYSLATIGIVLIFRTTGTTNFAQGLMICTPKVGHFWRCIFFMSRKKRINKKYSAEFKISVIMDMRENRLSYHEAVRKFGLGNPKVGGTRQMIKRWERIYLEEGAAGLMTERRGKKAKGRPRKKPLDKEIENDLIAENQRLKERNQYLEAELECIKKLSALVIAEEQEKSKKH